MEEATFGASEALVYETFGLGLLSYLCAADEASMRERLNGSGALASAAELVFDQTLIPLARLIAERQAENPGIREACC